MDQILIEEFIQKNKSNYVSKYKFHSFYKKNDHLYKFHYYMRDSQLQEFNIFLEINDYEGIDYTITEPIHDYEQKALMVDALKRIAKINGKSAITHKQINEFIKNRRFENINDYDLIIILNNIEYHYGINQKAVDIFYSCFLDYIKVLLDQREFQKVIKLLTALSSVAMYEIFWTGTFNDYLDQQYYLHLYYIRLMFEMCITKMDVSVFSYSNEFIELLRNLFKYPRFALCMISVLDHVNVTKAARNVLINTIILSHKDLLNDNKDYLYRYIQGVYREDINQIKDAVEEIFKYITEDIIRLTNHDMQIALGTYFLEKYGYDILINVFALDYNANLFKAFEIKDIPSMYYPTIQEQLRSAIMYYSELLNYPDTKLKALEQLMLINRIILENFKDTMYKS